MKNKEVFLKDPLGWQIVNNGVSSNNEIETDTLSYELSSFVCEGEYKNGLRKILEGFLGNLGKEQAGAWVSGFYGSGKSHLVKVLRYLWTDKGLGKGVTPRSLANLPPEIKEALTELSNRAKTHGGRNVGRFSYISRIYLQQEMHHRHIPGQYRGVYNREVHPAAIGEVVDDIGYIR